jgi:AcrR family transcriptional regulator
MGYTRKKEPELVRRAILDHAIQIAADYGYAGVTVQAVAAAAGVTKGGLFHHFPSKLALAEGMFKDLLEKLDADLDKRIALDRKERGSFTRAYVNSVFENREIGLRSVWPAIGASMMGDPFLRDKWETWLKARMRRHARTDRSLRLDMVRLAADGAWVAGENQSYDAKKMHKHLIELTHA